MTIFVIFISVWPVRAAPNWDIYNDATIGDGSEFNVVNVYDTSPDHTTVDMTGGIVDQMSTYDFSTLNLTAGNISSLYARESSTANISGGSVYGIQTWDSAVVHFSATASATSIGAAGDFATLNMSGGATEYLGAGESGTVNLYGGSVTNSINAWDSGIVNVFGYDLAKTSSGGAYDYGQVYGFFMDSTPFSIEFSTSETYDHVNLIPEPGTLSLFALALLYLRKRN